MKKILNKISIVLSLALAVSSCDFDTELQQNVDTADAFKNVQDVSNGTTGAYQALANYPFLGNYAIAFGDFAGGLANGSASSGHFYSVSYWSVSDTDEEMEGIWQYGFKVVDAAVRTINGADALLAANPDMSDDDKATIYYNVSQCYALRALAYFTMTQYFCYPYSKGADQKGLPIVKDQPVEAFQNATRASLGDTYSFMLDDIKKALEYNEEAGSPSLQYFFLNKAAIYALKARVCLYMGNYADAEAAAKKAIELKGKGNATYTDLTPNNETYLTMWASLNPSDEDIFTLSKTTDDNLSANALNTLWGSYYGKVSTYGQSFFSDTDVRAQLIGVVDSNSPASMKWQGIESSQATSNIPIFRKSEMALIIAECEARNGNITEAQKYVGYTAKRDSQYAAEDGSCDLSKLPSDKDALLEFIWKENTREFLGEGHFYSEARRLDKTVTVMAGTCTTFRPANFVFPIPAAEINAGFMKDQNTGWEDGLPERD
ncbi:RagB/SusD family nutrient uptake outer membrane protein [Prevotella sp.]|uniref:RagB/SusD family nutrient uptake outer membrane protein n=1 Tax=Prevotella sp. TaxID=59823 RepID=UPI0025E94AF8|nr:RagB/SusD family nutrient uptake outer membrane protein [Prevotella sp.]